MSSQLPKTPQLSKPELDLIYYYFILLALEKIVKVLISNPLTEGRKEERRFLETYLKNKNSGVSLLFIDNFRIDALPIGNLKLGHNIIGRITLPGWNIDIECD